MEQLRNRRTTPGRLAPIRSTRTREMNGLTILLGTTSAGLQERLTEVLQGEGFDVKPTDRSSSLLAGLEASPPDLVLLSDDLAETSVLDLTSNVHEHHPKLPIIVVATKPSVRDAVEAIKHGAYYYLESSIANADLLDVVAGALELELERLEEVEHRMARRIVSFEDLESIDVIDSIMERHGYARSKLMGILQDIQKEMRYLTHDALRHVAGRLGVPLPRVYSVATFYKSFSLKPRGRHTVSVCLGTACHVKGGVGVLEKLERELGIKAGETTFDERFSLESVRCVGCCGLAPVFVTDEDFHGKVTQDKIASILEEYE
jgi:NADH-quinone oxidoreductase subunit E